MEVEPAGPRPTGRAPPAACGGLQESPGPFGPRRFLYNRGKHGWAGAQSLSPCWVPIPPGPTCLAGSGPERERGFMGRFRKYFVLLFYENG